MLEIAEAAKELILKAAGQRTHQTPLDDICGKFGSSKVQYLATMQQYPAQFALAQRVKDKPRLDSDLLDGMGVKTGKAGTGYVTLVYKALCFSEIKGNVEEWKTYRSSQECKLCNNKKKIWKKRKAAGEMILNDIATQLDMGWLFLFLEDVRPSLLQE